MNKLVMALVCCFVGISSPAQTAVAYSEEYNWAPYPVVGNLSCVTGIFRASYEKGVVYLNDSAAVFPVKYVKGQFGIVKAGASAKAEWEVQVSGYVIGVCKKWETTSLHYIPTNGAMGTFTQLLKPFML